MDNLIDNVKKFLVTSAEKLIDKYGRKFITDTQINNMIELSNDSCCREEIENFIKYQIGRDRGRDRWHSCGKDILNMTDSIEKKLKEFGNNVKDDTIVEAISLFFGYLKRYSKYANN